jgi:hypothetical protein
MIQIFSRRHSITVSIRSGRQRDLKFDPTCGACGAPGTTGSRHYSISKEINGVLRKGDLAAVAFILSPLFAFILDTAAARQQDHAQRLGSAPSSERALRYVFLRSHFGNHNAIQRFMDG